MKNARFLLHLLLITALSAALYPFPLLLAIWSGSAGWTAPVMTAALVLCVWLGTLYILLLRRQYARHPRWVNGGVWALTLLLCVLGSLFAPYPTRLAQVLLGITAGGCFFGGARLVFHPLEHLVHPNVFVGLCLWDCFSGFLIYLTRVKLPFLPMVLLFAANAALFALVHNRDAMERMLSGRDGDTWELPTEIRRSNGRLMGILCGVGLALVLCSRPLARGMRWLWRWIYTGFFYALRWLLSLGSSSDTAEEIPESARDKLMELPQGGSVCIGMLPLFIYFFRWDWKHSFLAAFAYGLLQLIFDGAYAWGPTSMLLDYVLAFTVLGVATFFRKMKGGLYIGATVACVCRFLVHFISGVTIYRINEPTELFNSIYTNPWLYSAVYNGSYVLIDLILCLAILAILSKPMRKYLRGDDIKAMRGE